MGNRKLIFFVFFDWNFVHTNMINILKILTQDYLFCKKEQLFLVILCPIICNKSLSLSVFRRNNRPDHMTSRFASLFLLFFCFFISDIQGQDYLTLRGKIIDHKSGKAISFAHVGIPEKGIGTTTGFDGRFELKIPATNQNSTLTVSYMGYETYRKKVSDFAFGSTIKLKASVGRLTEVVVMDRSAIVDIIRRGVRNIPKNYPSESSNMIAFYRESLTDDSLRYRYLAEGVLKVFKYSYKNKKAGHLRGGLDEAGRPRSMSRAAKRTGQGYKIIKKILYFTGDQWTEKTDLHHQEPVVLHNV